MVSEYYEWGELLPDLDAESLEHEESRQLLAACSRHPSIEIVALRRLKQTRDSEQEISHILDGIVVECCDGSVPSRSTVGIKNRERLLLIHSPKLLIPHEVRALRINFPATPHQNIALNGAPPSLCLYFEPWSAVERTWTPAKHLQRIFWWLTETALKTLHRSDQPLERLYFISPWQIVLPADFREKARNQAETLHLELVQTKRNSKVLRGSFKSKASSEIQSDDIGFDILIVTVPPIVSMQIERYPCTLGSLHNQLTRYSSELLFPLINAAKNAITSTGQPIQDHSEKHTLLLLQMPMARSNNDAPERTDVNGFIIHKKSLAQLGIACGAYCDGKDGKAYVEHNFGREETFLTSNDNDVRWRHLTLEPVDVRFALSLSDVHQASSVNPEGANFLGALAGVGALGSSMAELWSREGWGNWSYIDDDLLEAHNLVRHLGKDSHIGQAKVDVVHHMVGLNWPTAPKPKAICAKANDFTNPEVRDVIFSASLFVDATTTLEVPRDLSGCNNVPRTVSVFLTPSGQDCVLLLEDLQRDIRLSSLEAQYYRAILNSDWGSTHLIGHQGSYWVGAGCRDLSNVLSPEVVQLHSATLARQIRLLSARPEAHIRVWSMDKESGALAAKVVPVMKSLQSKQGKWNVAWDEGLKHKLNSLRAANLPNETGGIILGYVDQKSKTIQMVDILPAPFDSKANQTTFTRGACGMKEAIERSSELTANIVNYLGEWHSHPKHSSAKPSAADTALLAYLAKTLAMDGMPALMIIVGETDISISLKEEAV